MHPRLHSATLALHSQLAGVYLLHATQFCMH